VKKGEQIIVIGLHEDGWWAGAINSRLGTFPSRCICSPELPLPTHMEKLLQLSAAQLPSQTNNTTPAAKMKS